MTPGDTRLCGAGWWGQALWEGLFWLPPGLSCSPRAAVRGHWASSAPAISVSCSNPPSPTSPWCAAPLLLPGPVCMVGTAGTGQDLIPREASDSSSAPLGHRACRSKELPEILLFRFIQTEKTKWKSENNLNLTLEFLGFALKCSPRPTLELDSQAAPSVCCAITWQQSFQLNFSACLQNVFLQDSVYKPNFGKIILTFLSYLHRSEVNNSDLLNS